jgi:hypothetical protein
VKSWRWGSGGGLGDVAHAVTGPRMASASARASSKQVQASSGQAVGRGSPSTRRSPSQPSEWLVTSAWPRQYPSAHHGHSPRSALVSASNLSAAARNCSAMTGASGRLRAISSASAFAVSLGSPWLTMAIGCPPSVTTAHFPAQDSWALHGPQVAV